MTVLTRPIYAAAIAAALLGTAARADDPPQRVGRLSYIEGTVSFHAADENDWTYATLNYPMVTGNALWTEPDARSEVQIGAVEIRMDHSTEMEIMRLDDSSTQIAVPQGVVNIHFSTPPLSGSIEVDTPSGPIELTQPGTYHIDAGAPGTGTPVQVTPLEGQLEIRSERAVLQVMQGETAVLTGNPPAFSLQEGNPTPFDDWALARERREEAHAAAQYVSPHMTGYEDLDYYGQWAPDPSYGTVWYPTTVQADWAPYRYGHWAFIAPWGWTWVDNAPWGFAPFHYGRWANINGRWGWIPGQIAERPVYAPALVAFVGGAGWSVSLSLGNETPAVGWVPLAPNEVFYPYYRTSPEYVRNVNIVNVNRTVINNITVNNVRNINVTNYVNRGAATVVPSHAFEQGQPVHKSFIHVPQEQMAHAQVTPTLTHLTPSPAAREEGRPMADGEPNRQAQSGLLKEPYVKRAAGSPENATASTPEVQHTEHSPQEPVHNVQPLNGQAQPQEGHRDSSGMIAYQHGEQHEAQPTAPSHAPGPPVRHIAPEQQHAQLPPPEKREPLPHAAVPHPQQHTQITPTPKGWQRMPQQEYKEQPHPQQGQSHPAPGPEHDEHHGVQQ